MLQRFLPLLAMTFCICLFIVLMQFMWRYMDDLVGKGLSLRIVAELVGYMALTLVPTALPLAILLASLMTFGNLGEKFELTALKASGISLFKIMRPLIVLIIFIAVGAFFFQNDVLPMAQTKMWTLLFSARQKTPEVEIPERAFYDQLPNINLYIEKKNRDTGMLYDLIIYDTSRGFDNSRIILADSGSLAFTEDKTRLYLHLYQGEQFENLRDNSLGGSATRNMPFRREMFFDKTMYIPFDANFNRMDDSVMRQQYIGKNIAELNRSIDSLSHRADSIGTAYGHELQRRGYMGIPYYRNVRRNGEYVQERQKEVHPDKPIDVDSALTASQPSMQRTYLQVALNKARDQQRDFEYRSAMLSEQQRLVRRHEIELMKKFTLSLSCLIFFFIGAPLGAIIKKGGIGTPLVISVLLFIVYYFIDNTGYKMARDGKIEVWFGMWLSAFVLLPLGIFLTYKAVGDTAVINIDAIGAFFRRMAGKRDGRAFYKKEVIMDDVQPQNAIELLEALRTRATEMQQSWAAAPWWRRLAWRTTHIGRWRAMLQGVSDALDDAENYLANSENTTVIKTLNDYPPLPVRPKEMQLIIDTTNKILPFFIITHDPNEHGED